MSRLRRGLGEVSWAFGALVMCGCQVEGGPDWVVAQSIERYGGSRFVDVQIQFEFRGTPFAMTRQEGGFHYQRTVRGPDGQMVTEVMEDGGTWAEVGGARVSLSPDEIYEVETAVNSVIYFSFLPFRLDDGSVILRDLGSAEVAGEPYYKIEATFEQEGGGTDWDTRFVHWFHRDRLTLDYLAYSYSRDGGGSRFRRAVNRRDVGGLTIQDYENYAGDSATRDIAELDRLYDEGALELLSMVELERVEVRR